MTNSQSRAYQSAADQRLDDHLQQASTSSQSLAEGLLELHKSQMPVISQLQHHQSYTFDEHITITILKLKV